MQSFELIKYPDLKNQFKKIILKIAIKISFKWIGLKCITKQNQQMNLSYWDYNTNLMKGLAIQWDQISILF